MKAVGRITHVDSVGRKSVDIYIGRDFAPCSYLLSNANEIPDTAPDFGLFEFCPDDQFCKWIDPNK